ncbi:MAG TPA: GTPase HflX [Stellaceae bacterium]|nr:GTPase HflX [Stellaceae bacterium]
MTAAERDHRVSVGRCLVVHPILRNARGSRARAGARASGARSPQSRLEEAAGLAAAIALHVVHAEIVRVSRWNPATLLGGGAVESIAAAIAEKQIEVAVIDAAVTPVQQRNLETAWKCKVIDRTGLILEIFGERARTHEGALQVELAALTYQRSRLVRSWTHLERQRGGFGFLGGPGESQLEMDRRLITDRITVIKRELEGVKRTREIHRGGRKRVPYPVVALVGYTNSGKSTLFNRLTKAEVTAADMLFATLDPTMRKMELPAGRPAILSDTVGFVSDLPTMLVAAFRATLEEVAEADLIVHVRDVHHPDCDAQRDDVHGVLAEMGLGARVEHGLVEALNKIDLLTPEQRNALLNQTLRNDDAVPISAVTGEGCDKLLALVDSRLDGRRAVHLDISLADGATLAWLYQHGTVVKREDDDSEAHLDVKLSDAELGRFQSRRVGH